MKDKPVTLKVTDDFDPEILQECIEFVLEMVYNSLYPKEKNKEVEKVLYHAKNEGVRDGSKIDGV